MATKTVTCCDITNEICNRTFRIGLSDGEKNYILELGEPGMKILLGELINGISPEMLNCILERLISPRWRETLVKDA